MSFSHPARLAKTDSAPDGIVIVNASGHIVFANAQAARLFGYEPAELRGEAIDVLVPLRLREAYGVYRAPYFAQARPPEMGAGLELYQMQGNLIDRPMPAEALAERLRREG